MAVVVNRPADKRLVDLERNRVILEWDNFFYLLAQAVNNIQASSTFTLGAASSTTVSDSRMQSSSFVSFTPANAAAATLDQSTKSLYVDTGSTVPGESFTVRTADGTAAAGTEIFLYNIVG